MFILIVNIFLTDYLTIEDIWYLKKSLMINYTLYLHTLNIDLQKYNNLQKKELYFEGKRTALGMTRRAQLSSGVDQ